VFTLSIPLQITLAGKTARENEITVRKKAEISLTKERQRRGQAASKVLCSSTGIKLKNSSITHQYRGVTASFISLNQGSILKHYQ
jgi:hypothetical protein